MNKSMNMILINMPVIGKCKAASGSHSTEIRAEIKGIRDKQWIKLVRLICLLSCGFVKSSNDS